VSIVILVFSPLSSLARGLEFLGSVLVTGSYVKTQAVGNRLYAVNRWGLQIFDTTRPDTLLLLGQFPTPDEAFGITIHDNYAFIADRSAGFIVVDVSNPRQPFSVGQYDTPGGTNAIAIADTLAYLADGENGLVIVNIKNPSTPALVSRFSLPDDGTGSRAMGIAVRDHLVYLAAQATGMIIIDVSNPREPQSMGLLDTPGWAHEIVLKDNLAFIADRQNGLIIANVANPRAPSLVAGFLPNQGLGIGTSLTFGVAVNGNYAYITDTKSSFIVGEPPPHNLTILNVSNPRNPTFAGGYYAGGEAVAVAIDSNAAYLALADNGMQRVEVGDPASPALSGRFSARGSVNNLAVQDNYGYVAFGAGGMVILDLAIPAMPAAVGRYPLNNAFDTVRSIAVRGGRAYLGRNFGNLTIVDVTSPFSPRLVAAFSIPVDSTLFPYIDALAMDNVFLYAGYTYASTGAGGLLIFDVSQPDNPSLVTNYEIATSVHQIEVRGGCAFVAAGKGGVIILDVTNPHVPTLVNQIQTVDFVRGVTIDGANLLVAEGEAGLSIFDVTDPGNPAYVSGYGTTSVTYAVTVRPGVAYVANFSGREALTVLDVSNPRTPSLIEFHDTPGFAERVVEHNGHLYVIDSYDLAVFGPNTTGVSAGKDKSGNGPRQFFLLQNYPNPLKASAHDPETTIQFYLPKPAKITLEIFDISGRLIRSLALGDHKAPGRHTVLWNGLDNRGHRVRSGVYFYQLRAENFVQTQKMLIIH
jgi:hypothetical protein